MFCSNCGNQLAEDALYCQECGEKVNSEEKAAHQPEEGMPDTTINNKNNAEDVHAIRENITETSFSNQTDAKKFNTAGQDKFNKEDRFEHYREMSQDMLDSLKKVPYQGVLDRLKNMPLKWKIGAGIGILLVIVLCTRIHKPGEGVRDAYLESYSNSITVEEAFDSFFDNGKWSEHKEDGDVYVVFTGECTYLDKKADIKIRFRIKGDHFYFANMEMNGQPQSDIISEALLDKVYEGYY